MINKSKEQTLWMCFRTGKVEVSHIIDIIIISSAKVWWSKLWPVTSGPYEEQGLLPAMHLSQKQTPLEKYCSVRNSDFFLHIFFHYLYIWNYRCPFCLPGLHRMKVNCLHIKYTVQLMHMNNKLSLKVYNLVGQH